MRVVMVDMIVPRLAGVVQVRDDVAVIVGAVASKSRLMHQVHHVSVVVAIEGVAGVVRLGNHYRKAFGIGKDGEKSQVRFVFPDAVSWRATGDDIAENTVHGAHLPMH